MIFLHTSVDQPKDKTTINTFKIFLNWNLPKCWHPHKPDLSFQACVHRILNQFDALKHYFLVLAIEDPTYSNERISSSLNNMFTEAYSEFLSYQLNRINSFNRIYQSEKPVLHLLKDQVEELIRRIAEDLKIHGDRICNR